MARQCEGAFGKLARSLGFHYVARMKTALRGLLVGFACTAPAVASAEERPAGLVAQDAPSGVTDVATEGFQTATRPEDSTDATDLNVSLGGMVASGNSRAISATFASAFKLRRSEHQLGAAAAANFGRSASDPDLPMETTVENYQARARYDYFFARYVTGFLLVSARRDRFQGLDLRLNFDPGVAYYFIDVEKHQLWAEGGYDLQHDVRRQETLDEAEADSGTVLARTETRHHARLFAGYDNKLNRAVSFNTGLEYLQGISPFEDEDSGRANWRLNWESGLTSSLADSFSASTTLSLRYDNNPLPGVERTDIVTAVSLVYTLY